MMFRISILILFFFISCNSDSEKNKIEELPKSWEEGIEINFTDKFDKQEAYFDLTIRKNNCVLIDGLDSHLNKLEFSFSDSELDSILLLLSQANFLEMVEEKVTNYEYIEGFPLHRTILSYSNNNTIIKKVTIDQFYLDKQIEYSKAIYFIYKLISKYIEQFTFDIELVLSDNIKNTSNRIIFVDYSSTARYNDYFDGSWGNGSKFDLIAGNKAIELNIQLPDGETYIYDTVIKFQSKPFDKFILKMDFINGNYFSELIKVEE